MYDTDTVLIGIDRQYYEDDAHWFAKYLNEAICERLRRVFNNTIGLGQHPEAELLQASRPALQLHPHDFSMGDVPRRPAALRREDPMASSRRMLGPTRPSDLRTNYDGALNPGSPDFENWWTFVEHIRADYEPTDDPSWEEVAQDLRGGRDMMAQSNWKQYNRSGSRKPDA
ncbi:hypothetical protein ACIRL0_04635 [Streptomyces sp. NPDC102365]|uniref:hypothetical protein n=1 Tax=Streptomyces sp. NPDC102365 TaxID=3366162 RepID=UPI00380EA051